MIRCDWDLTPVCPEIVLAHRHNGSLLVIYHRVCLSAAGATAGGRAIFINSSETWPAGIRGRLGI